MALPPKNVGQMVAEDGIAEATDGMLVVVSDPSIPDGPGKKSKVVSLSGIRGTEVTVVVDGTNSPYQASPGQVIYVDNRTTDNLSILLPATPQAGQRPITIYPLGSAALHPFNLQPGASNAAGEPGEQIDVTSDNVVFQVRYVNATYGYGFFSMGGSYSLQTVTVNASDLVNIRYVESGDVQLIPTDREHGVATVTDISGGFIRLPNADDVSPGWQTSVFQLGDGVYSFALNDTATGEQIIALGNQLQTLGRGTMITVILTRDKKWLIGGGLTGV